MQLKDASGSIPSIGKKWVGDGRILGVSWKELGAVSHLLGKRRTRIPRDKEKLFSKGKR